jgi:hypothetical protein
MLEGASKSRLFLLLIIFPELLFLSDRMMVLFEQSGRVKGIVNIVFKRLRRKEFRFRKNF